MSSETVLLCQRKNGQIKPQVSAVWTVPLALNACNTPQKTDDSYIKSEESIECNSAHIPKQPH